MIHVLEEDWGLPSGGYQPTRPTDADEPSFWDKVKEVIIGIILR